MGKTRAAYPPEFRRQMVDLVRGGRSPEELAREFEPTAQSIRNWLAQCERNAGRGDGGLTTAEREELNRLGLENRQLRLDPTEGFQFEREILSKAAAWFARETDTCPRRKTGQSCPKDVPPSIRLRRSLGHHSALLSPDHASVTMRR